MDETQTNSPGQEASGPEPVRSDAGRVRSDAGPVRSDAGPVRSGAGPVTTSPERPTSAPPPETSGADPQAARARRLPMALVTWAFVVLVLLIVVVLLVVKVTRGSTTVPTPAVTPASPAVVQEATSVPASVFDEVGAPQGVGTEPVVLSGQPPLQISGLPGVVFVGAEFCPYCAAERWALVVALGRFGKFSRLGSTTSSKFEVFGGTPTFSFDGASYRSRYLSFSAVEEYGQSPSTEAPAGFPELQTLPAMEQSLLRRYDGSQVAGYEGSGSLPFVDVGNKLVVGGADIGFSPGLLQSESMARIAGGLSSPANPLTVAIVAEANDLTAGICAVDGGLPKSVCGTRGVEAAALGLGTGR